MPRQAVCRGRNRRLGKIDAVEFVAQVAAIERLRCRVQRMEFFTAGEGYDEAWQEEEAAYACDLLADSFHGFCRPDGAQHSAAAEGGSCGAVRPIYVHRVCEGCGAGNGSRVGARSLWIRGATYGGVLLSRSAGDGDRAAARRAGRIQILRGGH